MTGERGKFPFKSRLNLRPLIDYALERAEADCGIPGHDIIGLVEQAPELMEPLEDPAAVGNHQELIRRLMSLVFPPVFWESRAFAAMTPFVMQPFFYSPLFAKLFFDHQGRISVRRNLDASHYQRGRLIIANLLVLEKIYGIKDKLDFPLVNTISDPETGLDRHYQIQFDTRFVDVEALVPVRELSPGDHNLVQENLTDPQVLAGVLPPENFLIHGFTAVQPVEVTVREVISALQRDLIDQESLISPEGFARLQDRLRTLFGRPDLVAAIFALSDGEVMMLNHGCHLDHHCIFTDSQHLPVSEFRGTSYERCLQSPEVLRFADVLAEPGLAKFAEDFKENKVRSMLSAPLFFEGAFIGGLEIKTPVPGELTPMDAMILAQLQPMFAMAIKKALNDLNRQVEAVIKEKCTAMHPSVEWRFRQAALKYLGTTRAGAPAVMEPIVFKDVYPLYGGADVRGSSNARNQAISRDLASHLDLGLAIVKLARDASTLTIFDQLASRLSHRRELLDQGLGTGDEAAVIGFMRREVEANFDHLRGLGPKVLRAVDEYRDRVDPHLGTVYEKRREFEKSVSLLNDRLAAYLDQEEAAMQQAAPHYFQRHRTDGVDYIIYAGEAIMAGGGFNPLLLKNLRLWQLMVACGMAWHTENLQPSMAMPLDTAHLILVQNAPLSVRFRFDEKRFDVDGAYDIRYEIIRSRLDKAQIKGTGERLTQPGRIAVVYSSPSERLEMRRHVEYLQDKGYLTNDLERLDLEALPGVSGLKALRVGVNLESGELSRRSLEMAS